MKKTATKPRSLRGGVPLWADTDRTRIRFRRNLGAVECDVVVLGAGVSGAVIALSLAEAGKKVVVLDRRRPVTGSTLASTAMIQFEVDTPLSELAQKIGARRAERAYLRSFRAVSALHDLIDRHQVACAWKPRDALFLAGDEMGSRALQKEASYRERIGLPVAYLNQSELRAAYGFCRTGAIVSSGNAEVNPAQLAAGCLRRAQALGVEVYSPHEARDIVGSDDSVALRTASGLAVIAKKAVFATGYELSPQIPEEKYDIISTWAIATSPLPEDAFWPTRCLVWEAADPYIYMRSTADNRIVAGGEDAPFDDAERRDSLIDEKSEKILAKVSKLLPGREFTVDYAWAGAFADSPTGLPYLSDLKANKNCFAVLGCGGNGITFSIIAAEIITAWVAGKTDADADLFR